MLNKHFREFIELLGKHEVRYLVVGGYAVGFHGFPRYTGDLDVFIGISEENSQKALKVFLESDSLKVPFIGYDKLLENKKASPRAKDKIDLEELNGSGANHSLEVMLSALFVPCG